MTILIPERRAEGHQCLIDGHFSRARRKIEPRKPLHSQAL
jgi:hypothetical protein